MNRMNLAEQYRAKPKCDEEIADAYARGLAPDEIARELGVLPLTVERGLQRQGLLRLVPRESAGPVELGVGDPVRCPDETWCVWAGEVPRMWGSSEAAVLSDVSERVGSVDLARELMEGGARRWELIADAHPALHRALVRKLRVAPQPAPAPAPPPADEEDEEDDAPTSALEDVMEHVSEEMEAPEVAAEAPTPAPEEIAPEDLTPIDVASAIEEAAQADAHPAYQWMTANELAPLMQVEKSTLRLWAKGGKLEVRDAPAGRARGPKAKEYRIPPGQPVPSPGPQARSVTGTPPRPDTRDRGSVQPAGHPAYQWTRGSRAMGDILGVDVGTVFAWSRSGKLESRAIEGNARDHEWRVPPGQPVPVPLITGGRARQAPQPATPALSPSRIEEETRLHAQLTAARSRCAELDAQIEALTAKLAEREAQLVNAEQSKADTLAAMSEAVTRLRAQVGEEARRARVAEEALASGAAQTPVSLRSVLDEVARWAGCAVIGLDVRLETGARIGVTP